VLALTGAEVSHAERALRPSPTPEGRCWWVDAEPTVGDRDQVAILTDPGGPVLVLRVQHRHSRRPVAILTDPGGPVLALSSLASTSG